MSNKHFQRGVSLLELVLVLAVATMLILFVASRYKQSQWDQNLAVTQRSVQTLLQALNHYFYQHCNEKTYEASFSDVEVSSILRNFKPELIANPLALPSMHGDAFVVQIVEVANVVKDQPIYQLKLSANYPENLADNLRPLLGGDPGTGSVITWTRLPSLSNADPSAAYWIQSDAFNQGATAGLRAYASSNPNSIFIGVCNNRGPKPSS